MRPARQREMAVRFALGVEMTRALERIGIKIADRIQAHDMVARFHRNAMHFDVALEHACGVHQRLGTEKFLDGAGDQRRGLTKPLLQIVVERQAAEHLAER